MERLSINDIYRLKKEYNNSEAIFFDYKEKWHDNNAKLVHDILCLQNAEHNDDRFLIFGVSDDGDIVGVNEKKHRKRENDLQDLIKNSNINKNLTLNLYTINAEDKEIDVLHIKKSNDRPFFLLKDKSESRKTVRAGVIYIRNGSRNTAIDSSATEDEMETMWRERFNLDLTPLEKLEIYLKDYNGWEKTDELSWFYKKYPEYTISKTDEEVREVEGGEQWTKAAANPRAFVRPMHIKYHQTVLKYINCIYFDEFRHLIPAPRTEMCLGDSKWYFYISEDSFDYLFLNFLMHNMLQGVMKNGFVQDGRLFKVPVIIFKSEKEKIIFSKWLQHNPIKIESQHIFHIAEFDKKIISDQDKYIIEYSRAVIDALEKFRKII